MPLDPYVEFLQAEINFSRKQISHHQARIKIHENLIRIISGAEPESMESPNITKSAWGQTAPAMVAILKKAPQPLRPMEIFNILRDKGIMASQVNVYNHLKNKKLFVKLPNKTYTWAKDRLPDKPSSQLS